jgi:radical SAM superfamily enzyme
MDIRTHCQSCSMPLDNAELLGTEKDGSKSHEYCKYCYQNGRFTNPDMSLDEMQSRVIHKMEKEKIPEDIIEAAVSSLPHLKRWRNIQIA